MAKWEIIEDNKFKKGKGGKAAASRTVPAKRTAVKAAATPNNLTIITPEQKEKAQADYDEAYKWTSDYMKSPMYKKMLTESSANTREFDNIDKTRWSNFKSIPPLQILPQPRNELNTGGTSLGFNGQVQLFPYGFGAKAIYPHELSHSTDRPVEESDSRIIPQSDKNYISQHVPTTFEDSPMYATNKSFYDLFKKNKPKEYKKEAKDYKKFHINYVGQDTETRARLNAIRQGAQQNNLYDPFKEGVTPELYYDKLKNFKFEKEDKSGADPMYQLKNVYSDEEIIYMLNHISENKKENDGTELNNLPKAEKGLTIKTPFSNLTPTQLVQEKSIFKPIPTTVKPQYKSEGDYLNQVYGEDSGVQLPGQSSILRASQDAKPAYDVAKKDYASYKKDFPNQIADEQEQKTAEQVAQFLKANPSPGGLMDKVNYIKNLSPADRQIIENSYVGTEDYEGAKREYLRNLTATANNNPFSKGFWNYGNINQKAQGVGASAYMDVLGGANDFINPAYWIGNMTPGVVNIPYNLSEGNYGAAAMGLAGPLALAALTPGAKGFSGMANNLLNPLAGIVDANTVKSAGKYLTEKTPLKNAYKVNPWAFKPNSEMMYRGIGEAGMKDALESGVFRAKQNIEPLIEDGFNMAKQFEGTYYTPKFKTADQYGAGYIAEVPKDVTDFRLRYKGKGNKNWSQIADENIPIDKGKILQKDWLKGYKEIPKPASSFKSEINWGNWNKEIPENKALMQEYNAIEQQAKANGTWMKNPDGSSFQGTPEQFVQQNSENFKKYVENAKGNYNDVLEKPFSYHGSSNNNITEFHTPQDSDYIKATADTPEAGIFLTNEKSLADIYATKNKNGKAYELYAPANYARPALRNPNNIIETSIGTNIEKPILTGNLDLKDVEYLKSLNYTGIADHYLPNSSLEKVVFDKNIIKSAIGNNGMFDMTNPNIYKSILPYIGYTGAGALTYKGLQGLGAASALQQKKHGGIIEDPMGQWAHPGSVTRIPSNQITMQGVNYPVLGVSDRGHTQMMYPGEDYSFRGRSVTEYPMMGSGGEVNFTYAGENHRVYEKESPTGNGKGVEGHIMVNHPTKNKGKWDTIDLTKITNGKVKTVAQGVASTKKWHKENPEYADGGMIKRADGSYSKRGLWDNIRDNAGSGKKPTKEMLKQERKIKSQYANGGKVSNWEIIEDVPQFQKGGKVVSEIWEETTGSPWSEARKLGLTQGGYEENLKLRSELLKNPDKFISIVENNIPVEKRTPTTNTNKPEPAPIRPQSVPTEPTQNPIKPSQFLQKNYTAQQDNTRSNVQNNEKKVVTLPVPNKVPISNEEPLTIKTPFGNLVPTNLIQKKPIVNQKLPVIKTPFDNLTPINSNLKNLIPKENPIKGFQYSSPIESTYVANSMGTYKPEKTEDSLVKKTVNKIKNTVNEIKNNEDLKDAYDYLTKVRDFEDFTNVINRGLAKKGIVDVIETEEVKPMEVVQPKTALPTNNKNITPHSYYQGEGVIDSKTGAVMGRYVNIFSNTEGQEYIPTKNVGEWEKNRSTEYNSSQMAHYLLDMDLTTGYQHKYSKKMIEDQIKGIPIVDGSTLKEQWLPVYEKLPNGNVKIHYKTNNELTPKDKIASPLRQYRFGDLDWKSDIKSTWNKSSSAIKTKTGYETNLIKSGKNMGGYGQFGGGSFVLISKNPNTGEVVINELAGSLQDVTIQAKAISKLTGQDINEIILGYYDVGSWSAKPQAKDHKLGFKSYPKKNKNQWEIYQGEGTGAGLAFPFKNGGKIKKSNWQIIEY